MAQTNTNQYLDELFQWTRNIQTDLEGNSSNENYLIQEKLANLKVDLINIKDNSNNQSLETLQKLSKNAEEIYQELTPPESNNIETNLNRKRVETNFKAIPIGEHKLPPLPYNYNALEPYIDEEIMRLHHSEHHKSYVKGLNKAEKEMEKARKKGDFELIKHWEREAAFNGAGHYLHTIFWNAMSPGGGGNPKGPLAQQIESDFGSYAKFKEHFSEAAKKVEAVGWAILVWSPRSGRLEILQAEKHQNLSQWDVIPILTLDVWEHAYYLQYKNKRNLYVDNWWNVVNWDYANERFQKAKELTWEPF